jgi:hypothetical protein
MQRFLANIALSLILLAIPVVAQLATPLPNSMGLDLLLYFPFHYALFLLALILFLSLNMYLARKRKAGLWQGAALGGVAAISWFSMSFLVVAQLHLSLGGQL